MLCDHVHMTAKLFVSLRFAASARLDWLVVHQTQIHLHLHTLFMHGIVQYTLSQYMDANTCKLADRVSWLSHLYNEDHGRYEIKQERAVMYVKLGNVAALEHNPLSQIVRGNKGHIPAQKQLPGKGHPGYEIPDAHPVPLHRGSVETNTNRDHKSCVGCIHQQHKSTPPGIGLAVRIQHRKTPSPKPCLAAAQCS